MCTLSQGGIRAGGRSPGIPVLNRLTRSGNQSNLRPLCPQFPHPHRTDNGSSDHLVPTVRTVAKERHLLGVAQGCSAGWRFNIYLPGLGCVRLKSYHAKKGMKGKLSCRRDAGSCRLAGD